MIIAAEGKRKITHPAADLSERQIFFYPPRGFNIIDTIIVVLLHSRRYCENIGIKNNVLRWEADFFGKNVISTLANLDFSFKSIGLAFFIKRHNNDRSTIFENFACMLFELCLAFFHADGIHHTLALHAPETGFDHGPFRGVDHHWHPRNVRLGHNQLQKFLHRIFGVEHALVHIDVDYLGAVFNLLPRNG